MMRHRSCHGKPRIAIIGAGPAGLSAAYFLKKLEFDNVLVLEKLGRVGGMCRTLTEDYQSFDLGANYLTPAYRETLRLAREYKMKTYGERSPTALDLREPEGYKIRSIWKAARENASLKDLVCAGLRYTWLRFKLSRIIDRPGFKNISTYNEGELCIDFEAWLEKHDLGVLKPLFEIPITIMGYGYLHKIAAPYALKYMSLMTFVPMMFKVFPLTACLPWPKRFIKGYQRLWQAVSWDLNVRNNIEITGIERKENEPIKIHFNYKYQYLNEIKTKEDTFKFDIIIVACPLDPQLLGVLLDQDEAEQNAFKGVDYYSYCLTSYNVDFPDIPWEDQLFALMPLTPFKTPWAITRQMQDSNLLQFYTRVPKNENDRLVEEEVDQNIHDFIERLGGTIDHEEWHTYDRWPYFQHVSPEKMKSGFYDTLENLQGHRNTYYTGGLMNFELVEQIIAYNRDLVNRICRDLKDGNRENE